MTTNPKGYKPKRSREKFPLSINEQRALIEKAEDLRLKSLVVFILATGAHPSILVDKQYNLDTTPLYYSWNRPKTLKKVRGAWSKAMVEEDLSKHLKKIRARSGAHWRKAIADLGKSVGLDGVCPLQLRHTHFVNLARLGINPFDIAHGASTSLETVYQFYTIGMSERRKISKEDRRFLQWLMES